MHHEEQTFRAVITTIQAPTRAVADLVAVIGGHPGSLIVVGDKSGPTAYDVSGTQFFSLDSQFNLGLALVDHLPTSHYARKNIGYLVAMSDRARCIYETDDDNCPDSSWSARGEEVTSVVPVEKKGWVNVYAYFTDQPVWPRGFALDEVNQSCGITPPTGDPITARAPIQQGLANNSPDVDAIWRLVMNRPINFTRGHSVILRPGAWCPFNSQSTWWFPDAYPLMYLPSYCSFRVTDIWRSFIAQRCLWQLGLGVVFHGPEVIQERNAHKLISDFSDELPGYLRNREMTEILDRLSLDAGTKAVPQNMITCYEALVVAEFFPQRELELVSAWLQDVERMVNVPLVLSAH